MCKSARRISTVFLLAVVMFAAVTLLSMNSAEAAVRINSPKARVQTDDGNYNTFGTGGIEIPIDIQTATVWSYQYDRGPHHVWLRLKQNGQTIAFTKIDVDKSVTCKSSILFDPPRFGTFTLEVQVDKPTVQNGALVYAVSGESDFVPEASVTFCITHDHSGKFGIEPAWETEYTLDKAPTCTEEGSESIRCSVCGAVRPGSARTVAALGHKWAKASYTWKKDYSSVTAKAVCAHDGSHTLTETVKTASSVTKEPTFTAAGKKVYTAKFKNSAFRKQTKTVSLPKLIAVKKITLSDTSATLTRTSKNKKPTLTLSATVAPKNADNRKVSWKSSDTSVAVVNSKGVVTALKEGRATITCTAKDGSKVKAVCKITVRDKPVKKLVLNKTSATLKKGKKLTLKVTSVVPANALNQKVNWSSSNKSVATVDSDGVVTARKKGTCVITCTARDGSQVTVKCKITVK